MLAEGLSQQSVVGIYLEGSIDYIVTILGILEAGGIFLPLNTKFPSARLKAVVAKTQPAFIITNDVYQDDVAAKLSDTSFAIRSLIPDAHPMQEIHHLTALQAAAPNTHGERRHMSQQYGSRVEADGCYIMCTSGSTGEPKAILGSAEGLRHFIQWEINELGLDEKVRVSQLAPVSFDVSLRDIFVPLFTGGSIVLPEDDVTRNPHFLLRYMEAHEITLSHMVPTVFRMLTREIGRGACHDRALLPKLQRILIAGEPLYGDDIAKWRSAVKTGVELVNLYGPSETTLAKCYYRIKDDETFQPNDIIPLGRPIADTEVFIVHNSLPCSGDEAGEIHIKTPYMSLGYYNAPDLTAAAFIVNPLSGDSGDIVYRTGDLGRMAADGTIRFEGRKDNQIKLYGNRIDIGEIEVVLRRHPLVQQAAVAVKTNRFGDMKLIGYIIPEPGSQLTIESLHRLSREHLPLYMCPASYVTIKSLPLTHNNKIDRRGLLECDGGRLDTEQPFIPASTGLEEKLCELWCHVLELDSVGVLDNFFDVGGTSVVAVRLIGLIQERLHLHLPIVKFFEHPNIKLMARYLDTNQSDVPVLDRIERRAEKYRMRSLRRTSGGTTNTYGKSGER